MISFQDVSLEVKNPSNKIPSIRDLVTLKTKCIDSFFVLKNVSFKVQSGEKLGIIGTNGSGKTSLLRLIAGTYTATHGFTSVTGSVQPLISLGLGLNGDDTLIDNIVTMLVIDGMEIGTARLLAPELLEEVGLSEFANFQYKNLSSGMQMRANFSVILSSNPEILLIDEFFGAGDKNFIDHARAKMVSFIENSGIFIFSSHSRELIEKFCRRVIILERGEITFDGEVKDGCERYWG